MAIKLANTHITWIAGTLTTVLFLGTFVPITLQRSAEGFQNRSELALETVGRLLLFYKSEALEETSASKLSTNSAILGPDESPVAVILLDTTNPALSLAALKPHADWSGEPDLRTVVVATDDTERAFLSGVLKTQPVIIEMDTSMITMALNRELASYWLSYSFALNSGDQIMIGYDESDHAIKWYDREAKAQQTIEFPGLGGIQAVYHEHGQVIPIETLIALLLAAMGMGATFMGARIVRQLDVLNASTRTQLDDTEARLSISEEISGQAQKLDAVGKLTGGMAHDFNNLLTVILGNLELARDMTGDRNIIYCLEQAQAATSRGADLTKNMLSFARKATLAPEVLDLNKVVREAQGWMTRTLPASISVEVSLLAGLWRVSVDRSALETAILNLLLNAKDAMNEVGRMIIETTNVRIDKDYNTKRNEDLPPGRYVMLAVSDNGSGIRPEDIAMVFDPFFTTKAVGQGTGLGLSMVQGFLKQSGGNIRVDSELGIGTSFKLYFPSTSAQSVQGRSTQPDALEPTKKARVLLVEDDEPVRRVLAKTLRSVGYAVVEAANGDEGLELYGDGSTFDIVVTDIVMPSTLQGPELAKKIRKVRDDARFVFMSGYANEAQVHGNGLRPDDLRLMKPVARKDLTEGIESVLQTRFS